MQNEEDIFSLANIRDSEGFICARRSGYKYSFPRSASRSYDRPFTFFSSRGIRQTWVSSVWKPIWVTWYERREQNKHENALDENWNYGLWAPDLAVKTVTSNIKGWSLHVEGSKTVISCCCSPQSRMNLRFKFLKLRRKCGVGLAWLLAC